MAQVGHISPEVIKHYSYIRRQARNAAATTAEWSTKNRLAQKTAQTSKGRYSCGLFFVFTKVFGRGERIRTSDLSVPNRAHYQAVLRPEG